MLLGLFRSVSRCVSYSSKECIFGESDTGAASKVKSLHNFAFESANQCLFIQCGTQSKNIWIRHIEHCICRSMGLGNEVQKILSWTSVCGNLALHFVWLILHLIINVWYSVLRIARMVENNLISCGLLKSYNAVNISKVRYLAVVIESEEARETSKVLELLCWLASIGIKSICLYDREGVLKKSQTAIVEGLNKSQKAIVEGLDHGTLVEHVDLEFVSFADSKPAVAKAANLLFAKHYASTKPEKPNFTESDMSEALQAVGYGGPEPDLLLVYGPVRCHMGFPAWRIRYTEIIHMGTLKSMKFGSLIKAIHKFTKVHQNYGQ